MKIEKICQVLALALIAAGSPMPGMADSLEHPHNNILDMIDEYDRAHPEVVAREKAEADYQKAQKDKVARASIRGFQTSAVLGALAVILWLPYGIFRWIKRRKKPSPKQ